MGQVWQATDTQLNRQVALKILPDAFASDPDRLARFTREAQILASLNHPNIAQIHGIEEAEGTRALVLELVEGPTLADRIAKGPIPVDEALPIAKQIAEALEAAHEAGVIHRDLKPANIKVREDGTVKVLDFGQAKALDPAPEGESPTLTAAATQMGVIMGTTAYMSPEQARGKPVDKGGGDIWAFGCVLYELVTGHRTWTGRTATDLIAAVVATEPDFTTLPSELPKVIREILVRCLEKDPLQRLRDIGDVRITIGRVLSGPTHMQAPGGAERVMDESAAYGERRGWVALGATMLVAAVATGVWLLPADNETSPEWFSILPPQSTSGVAPEPALSPDGQSVLFRARNSAGAITLWVRKFDAPAAREIPETEGAYLPFWLRTEPPSPFSRRSRVRRYGALTLPAGRRPKC